MAYKSLACLCCAIYSPIGSCDHVDVVKQYGYAMMYKSLLSVQHPVYNYNYYYYTHTYIYIYILGPIGYGFCSSLSMITSSHGNIFHVTGHLLTGGFPSHKVGDVELFSLICAWTNGWANNGDTGDLRRHRAHIKEIFISISERWWNYIYLP